MSRSVAERVGSTPDAKVPPRVRARIFLREGGRCHISGRVIRSGEPWDLDHKVALINGGDHRETNLFPALRDKHREKTAHDVREKSIIARKQAKHLGIKSTRKRIQSKGFDKSPAQRSATRELERRS